MIVNMGDERVYRLEGAEGPWGDYGRILIHGMSIHLPREDGLIQLERTGPFIPPITFPGAGDVVVTRELRVALEGSGLTGLGFGALIKQHIVRLEWESWDGDADEPAEYPEGGEPEDYILGRPHSASAANAMGILAGIAVADRARGATSRLF